MYDGTYRGLRKRELEKCLKKENSIILLVMDINGLIALKKEYKKDTIGVFINTPKEKLKEFMELRGDTKKV